MVTPSTKSSSKNYSIRNHLNKIEQEPQHSHQRGIVKLISTSNPPHKLLIRSHDYITKIKIVSEENETEGVRLKYTKTIDYLKIFKAL